MRKKRSTSMPRRRSCQRCNTLGI